MEILYLDDSGKVHPNDPASVAVFAGFSVDEDRWHTLIRQITGAKAAFKPAPPKPNEWEIKSTDFLTLNNWQRAKKRKFCGDLLDILVRNKCTVFSISLDKNKANDALVEEKFVPLMLRRLVTSFNDYLVTMRRTGSVVMDWSTHQMDEHITKCVTAMTVVSEMGRIRGGVSYGSSEALPPLQVADIIASAIRRDCEGQKHVAPLAAEFKKLQFLSTGLLDEFGRYACSVGKVF